MKNTFVTSFAVRHLPTEMLLKAVYIPAVFLVPSRGICMRS